MMRSTLGCLGRLSWRYFWGPRGLSTLGWLGEEYLGIPANCPTKWSMRRTLTLKEDWGRNINTHMWGSIHMQVRELHIDAVMLWPTFWPRPVTKDWLCQQFRCATMLIVPQHSYKVCLHVHKHCVVCTPIYAADECCANALKLRAHCAVCRHPWVTPPCD